MTNYSNEGVMALIRFNELTRKDPLYIDHYAHLFLIAESYDILRELNSSIQHFEDLISVRHKLFLDEIENCIRIFGLSQIVSLGSGYCSCLSHFEHFKCYEVDRIEVLKQKLEKLGDQYKPICVPLDFSIGSTDVINQLSEKGFDSSKPSLFFMEGVLYYLDKTSIDNFLGIMATHIQRTESILIFDMQVGKNRLTPDQAGVAASFSITNQIEPLSAWAKLIERFDLKVLKFGNIAAGDKWGRLKKFQSDITSSLFIIGKA